MRGPDVAAIRVLVGPIEQQPVELVLGLGREGVVEGEVDNLEGHAAGHWRLETGRGPGSPAASGPAAPPRPRRCSGSGWPRCTGPCHT